MTQLEVLKLKAKAAGDLAEMWRGKATERYNEMLKAHKLNVILAVFLLASNSGWFCAFMWL